MFDCVAVTRGGWGDVWGFDSPQAARSHPIIQDGDAVVVSPEEVLENWNPVFLARLFTEVLGDRQTDARVREDIDGAPSEAHRDARCRVASSEAWDALRRAARMPPGDPAEIVRRITEDRRLHDEWYRRESARRSSVTQAQGAASTNEDKKPAAAKTEEAKTVGGFAKTAKIAFGADKEGKAYDTGENNPKRAGSKSHELFAKYKAGMTVEEASAAGISAAALKWDSEHGFIKIA